MMHQMLRVQLQEIVCALTETEGEDVGQSATEVEDEVELGTGDDSKHHLDFFPELLPNRHSEGS